MHGEILKLSRTIDSMHQAEAERRLHPLRAVYASSSWRLTRPLRAVGRFVKRQRGGEWQPL
jgi:hypothetical protein